MSLSEETAAKLRNVQLHIEDLETSIEERLDLTHTLHLEPSLAQSAELVSLVKRTLLLLRAIHQDVLVVSRQLDAKDLQDKYTAAATLYRNTLQRLENDLHIDIRQYTYEPEPPERALKPQKSVRFTDRVDEDLRDTEYTAYREKVSRNTLSNYHDQPLNALSHYHDDPDALHAPYHDSPPGSSADTESMDMESSQQMFARHQQMLLEQDSDLETLHGSILRQHQMGTLIGGEVDDHMAILTDLEAGIDYSSLRLNRATRRLSLFRKMCRENGSMVTIVILLVILVLLITVLN